MSMFTKRRKIVRQKQEKERKHWDEVTKRQNESMEKLFKTHDYIEKNHPEFESLSENERVKLFGKIYNQINET